MLPLIELATRDLLPDSEAQLLTAKEQEIVNLVREGASNKRIALKLGISLSTVKTHMRNIFAKTDVVNRTELVAGGFLAHG
ncbi:CsgBAC operon transcriptional regulatory protein [Serratia marcescens]|uniref:CsgBAC operon transcriptional regulatory protein n=1 Tax=Serratia marcescens TaxID=615 RepID=A0A379Y2G1_SERMA|nr:CsgBAC operon transcriptional regulatory protein [Serratia marcescens]